MGTQTTGPEQQQAPPQQQIPTQQSKPQRRATLDLLDMVIEQGVRENYVSKMVDQEIARDMFDQDYRLARIFAESGIFSDINKSEENQAIATAMTKIRLGRSWGLNESDSIQFIYFTNGRPAIMNELIAAKMRDAGFDWDIQWHWSSEDKSKRQCVGCTLWLKKWDEKAKQFLPVKDRDGEEVSESFLKADADTALIWEKGKQIQLSQKWNFISWARDMYFWRTLGRLKKFHCTNILRGAMTREEAQDAVDSTPPSEQMRGTVEAAEEIAKRKLQLMNEVTEATKPYSGHFLTEAMKAAFGKDWKRYTSLDVALLEKGVAALLEFFDAHKPVTEEAKQETKPLDEWGTIPGPEESFEAGAVISVKGVPYEFDGFNWKPKT